jgi:hypothetical protein
MNGKVAVLGCGPAGLLAAHAAAQLGWSVDIFSHKVRSKIHGAQILHEPIAGVTSPKEDAVVKVFKYGNRAGYALKVYGDPDAPCSWDDYEEGPMPVWSMELCYDRLWEKYEDRITNTEINPHLASVIEEDYELTVSSIPLNTLVPEGAYVWQDVHVYSVAHNAMGEMFIEWSGDPDHQWYRRSGLFGKLDYEFSYDPAEPSVRVRKPLRSTGTSEQYPQIMRVGRYGEFRKGVLINDAYNNVWEKLGGF